MDCLTFGGKEYPLNEDVEFKYIKLFRKMDRKGFVFPEGQEPEEFVILNLVQAVCPSLKAEFKEDGLIIEGKPPTYGEIEELAVALRDAMTKIIETQLNHIYKKDDKKSDNKEGVVKNDKKAIEK